MLQLRLITDNLRRKSFRCAVVQQIGLSIIYSFAF